MTDGELLQDYVRSGSQAAFAELVRRHTDWIYCTAVRLVREPTLAEDVVQAVFIVLVKKAGSLSSSAPLNQWLFRVTRYSAIHALRDEARRKRRERDAADLAGSGQSRAEDSAESVQHWNQIVAHLDAATARLGDADRHAVLLRFYERKSMADIGAALGVSEDAAKKRVARAINRLRQLLSGKDAALPAAGLETVLLAHATSVVQPAVARSLAQAAVLYTQTGKAGGRAVPVAKGAIKMILMKRIRRVAVMTSAAIFLLGLVGIVIAAVTAQPSTPSLSAQAAASSPATSVTAGTQSAESPYVQAIRLVKELRRGVDGRLIDASAPLDGATAAFLARNAAVFELLHAGAAAHSTDWGVGAGAIVNMQRALDQLNGVRPLASLDVLRARQRWGAKDSLGAQNDLLDALALGRNVAHDHPILIVVLVQVSIDQMVLTRWAQLLPTTPAGQLAALPDRLKQLPASPGMADVIRAEQQYAVNSSNLPAGVAASMAPFYDSVAVALKQNPTPTPEAFQKILDIGTAKITASSSIGRQLAQILVPSLGRAYNTISAAQATEELFRTGIVVVEEGDAAANRSVDPFGQGPFEYARTGTGFKLRSKLQSKGKPVTLDFGM